MFQHQQQYSMQSLHGLGDTYTIQQIRQCGYDIFPNESLNSSITLQISDQDDSSPLVNKDLLHIKNYHNLDSMLKHLVLPTDRTSTKKTYESQSSQRSRHNFSRQKYLQHPLYANKKNGDKKRLTHNYRSYKTQRSSQNNNSAKKIRRKIFDSYKQDQKIKDEKKQFKAEYSLSSKKYGSIKSRYREQEPVMKNLSGYIEKNIYGRLKTQTEYIRKHPKVNRQESERKWGSFIKKQQHWHQSKKNNQMMAKLHKQAHNLEQMNKKPQRKSPPKMTVQDYLGKLRRQSEKLKERLSLFTFQPEIKSHPLYQQEKIKTQRKHLMEENAQQKSKPKSNQYTVIQNPNQRLNFIFQSTTN